MKFSTDFHAPKKIKHLIYRPHTLEETLVAIVLSLFCHSFSLFSVTFSQFVGCSHFVPLVSH